MAPSTDELGHLLDRSKLLSKRARKLIEQSEEHIRVAHQWHTIALGRICDRCMLAQPTDEFDDRAPCEPKAS
jgi:hypothetical protein